MVRNQPANAGDMGSIPDSGISPRVGNGSLLQYYCLENSLETGAWGRREVNVTEQLSTHTHTHTHTHTRIACIVYIHVYKLQHYTAKLRSSEDLSNCYDVNSRLCMNSTC